VLDPLLGLIEVSQHRIDRADRVFGVMKVNEVPADPDGLGHALASVDEDVPAVHLGEKH
jgi:hypothetical protein